MEKLKGVKILFYSNYWDGPLTGLCEYENKIYRYDVLDEGDWDEENDEWLPRVYNVFEIEPWQLTYELYWHSLFCSNIATHTEYDKKLVSPLFNIKNNDFYKKQRKEYKKIDYSNNTIIGTFEY